MCFLLIAISIPIIHRESIFMYEGFVEEALIGDISKYYVDNKRMPQSWEEFAEWANKNHCITPWTLRLKELKSQFALKWGSRPEIGTAHSEKLFIVLDPELKGIEPPANNKLWAWCQLEENKQNK